MSSRFHTIDDTPRHKCSWCRATWEKCQADPPCCMECRFRTFGYAGNDTTHRINYPALEEQQALKSIQDAIQARRTPQVDE